MKLPPEQLITLFLTLIKAKFDQAFSADMERELRERCAAARGKERSEILAGIKQAVNQLLGHTELWPYPVYSKVNAALLAKGLPSLEKMDEALHARHKAILKRGVIEDDEECSLVMELLNYVDSDITTKQRIKLGKLVVAYGKRPQQI